MKTAWPKLPSRHSASVMILRHFQPSKMIFMDVSVIRTDSQVATLHERLVPELVLWATILSNLSQIIVEREIFIF